MEGNLKALRRYLLLHRLLHQFGIEEERVQLVWASASEGPLLAEAVIRMTEQLRQLGPLHWAQAVLGRNGGGLFEPKRHARGRRARLEEV